MLSGKQSKRWIKYDIDLADEDDLTALVQNTDILAEDGLTQSCFPG
jgi:hypothetical protein